MIDSIHTSKDKERNCNEWPFQRRFYKLLNQLFHGKTRESVRNRLKNFLYRVWVTKKVKYQTKKIDGAKSYQDVADSFGFDVYTFNKWKIMFDKAFYLSSGILELSNLFLREFIMKSCSHFSGRTIFGLTTWIVFLSSCIFREKRWSIIRFNYKKTRICLISKYFIKTNFYTVVGVHFQLVNSKPNYQTHFFKRTLCIEIKSIRFYQIWHQNGRARKGRK